jgi:hypothetical protein
MSDDTTDSAWFRNWYRSHDYPDVERWVQIAAERRGFAYVPPLEYLRYADQPAAIWEFWECEAI